MPLSKAARTVEAPGGFEGSEGAIALVRMDGFRLLAAAELNDELHQLVETATVVAACGTRAAASCKRTD